MLFYKEVNFESLKIYSTVDYQAFESPILTHGLGELENETHDDHIWK